MKNDENRCEQTTAEWCEPILAEQDEKRKWMNKTYRTSHPSIVMQQHKLPHSVLSYKITEKVDNDRVWRLLFERHTHGIANYICSASIFKILLHQFHQSRTIDCYYFECECIDAPVRHTGLENRYAHNATEYKQNVPQNAYASTYLKQPKSIDKNDIEVVFAFFHKFMSSIHLSWIDRTHIEKRKP